MKRLLVEELEIDIYTIECCFPIAHREMLKLGS